MSISNEVEHDQAALQAMVDHACLREDDIVHDYKVGQIHHHDFRLCANWTIGSLVQWLKNESSRTEDANQFQHGACWTEGIEKAQVAVYIGKRVHKATEYDTIMYYPITVPLESATEVHSCYRPCISLARASVHFKETPRIL